MKSSILLGVCILLFCSCSQDTRTKTELVDAIVEAQGLNDFAREIKAKSIAESKEVARMSYQQMTRSIPSAPKELLDSIQTASDQYTASIYEAWTVEESLDVWKNAYAVDLSKAELRKILANLESESGRKELAAAKRATESWRKFITQRSRIAAEKAMSDYTAKLRLINESTSQPKHAAGEANGVR